MINIRIIELNNLLNKLDIELNESISSGFTEWFTTELKTKILDLENLLYKEIYKLNIVRSK